MTADRANRGRQRARVVTWTLVAGAAAGSAAVAAVAAASPRAAAAAAAVPASVTSPTAAHPPATRHAVRHSDDDRATRKPAAPRPSAPQVQLAPPSSSQPLATSAGS